MMLQYTKEDDDMKFLFYCYDATTEFVKGDTLSYNGTDSLDSIIEQLYILAGEEFNQKKLNEFKRIRKAPTPSKTYSITVLTLLNYINIVKSTLVSGSLKNREYIEEFTKGLDKTIKFDPEFYFLDVRAGLITSIKEAEGMNKLYCENVRSNRDYFICSGLREVYSKEDLLGNTYLFILNIKKVKFKSLDSEGMICCCTSEEITNGENSSTEEKKTVEALKVNKKEGTKLEMEGFISLFDDIEYGKVDLAKSTYKACLSEFMVIDHQLRFKGIKLFCGDDFINTNTANGTVH